MMFENAESSTRSKREDYDPELEENIPVVIRQFLERGVGDQEAPQLAQSHSV